MALWREGGREGGRRRVTSEGFLNFLSALLVSMPVHVVTINVFDLLST